MRSLCLVYTLWFVLMPLDSMSQRRTSKDSVQTQYFESVFNRDKNWHASWHENSPVPRYVFGDKVRLPGGKEESRLSRVKSFLSSNRVLFRSMDQIMNLERSLIDEFGVEHFEFKQYFQNVPVLGGHYSVHVNKDDEVIGLNGVMITGLDGVDVSPTFAPSDVYQYIRTSYQIIDSTTAHLPGPELAILITDSIPRLVYQTKIVASQPAGYFLVSLDAKTGKIVEAADMSCSLSDGNGNVFKTDRRFTHIPSPIRRLNPGAAFLDGQWARSLNYVAPNANNPDQQFYYDPSSTHFDEVNGYYHVDRFRNDFLPSIGYPSINFKIDVVVHANYDLLTQQYKPNQAAAYLGYPWIAFGDGTSGQFYDLSHQDDILYHEYMHHASYYLGLIRGNAYNDAMHEAYSDYFAAAAYDPNPSDPNQSSSRLTLGEGITQAVPNHIRRLNVDKATCNYNNWNTFGYFSFNPPQSPHARGMIWSNACWDLRTYLQGTKPAYPTDKLIMQGLIYEHGQIVSVFNALNGLYLASSAMASQTGTNVRYEIQNIMAERAIGTGASMSGPKTINSNGTVYQWTANPINGGSNPTYEWWMRRSWGVWERVSTAQGGNSQTISLSFTDPAGLFLKCYVTNASTQIYGWFEEFIVVNEPPLSVSISGPYCESGKGVSATLTANVSGGNGSYSFYWNPSGLTTQTITKPISSCPQTYTVTVTSGSQSKSASKSVYYGGGSCMCGDFLFKGLIKTESGLPASFELSQNYPNPFNPSTEIAFAIPKNSHVSIKIYNMQGQLVKNLFEENLEAGYYRANWNGDDNSEASVASGVYIYRLTAGDITMSKKMTLVR